MSYLALPSTFPIEDAILRGESQLPSPHSASIHILDDDSLLNVFYLYRLAILGRDEDESIRFIGSHTGLGQERWWYKLAHVCQGWRNLILGSASYLRLCLVCTYRTPIADMLAHSPPLPLLIDCIHGAPPEDVFLAFERRDRVRCIRLHMPDQKMRKLITAMEEEYPVLEYMIMASTTDELTALALPETFQAPRLRGLVLQKFDHPAGSRLLTTAMGLETLALTIVHPSSYFQPNILLQWLSFMPQLEMFTILFLGAVPNSDVDTQLMQTNVTLPNLRCFEFQGAGAYVEAVVHRLTAPRLETFRIMFLEHPMFSIPSLLPFMRSSSNLGFDSAKFKFSRHHLFVRVYLHEEAEAYDGLSITVHRMYLNRQPEESSVAQIFRSLNQIFSTMEHLNFELEPYTLNDEAGRTEWRRLLKSFRNVKTLRVDGGLVKELSRCLRPDDGEHPLELLPKLEELTYSRSGDTGDAFTRFIDARQEAGRPVTLVRP